MNELIENVVKFYQSRFSTQIKYDSKTAKTIVVESCELKLRQLNPGAVLIVYRTLQRTVNSVDDLKNNPFSFLSEKDDRINGTIRSYQLMQTITSLTGWLPDSDHQHHPPMYTFICNGVNHCIIINNDGTIKVDGQLVHSVDHYVSMKAQLENPQ